jgi:hypothetical protein
MRVSSSSTMAVIAFRTRVEAYNTLLLEFFRDVPDAGRIQR